MALRIAAAIFSRLNPTILPSLFSTVCIIVVLFCFKNNDLKIRILGIGNRLAKVQIIFLYFLKNINFFVLKIQRDFSKMENFWKNINRKVFRFENFEIKFQYRGFLKKDIISVSSCIKNGLPSGRFRQPNEI
jgi:hypothetical protein